MNTPYEFDGKIKGLYTSRILVLAILASLTFAAFADSTQTPTGTNLEIEVRGISSSHGNVRLTVFPEADAASFPDHITPLKKSAAATGKSIIFHFNNLATGNYAVMAFHDENGNEVLDRNLLGIPQEHWGVTGKRPFGRAPRYTESTFVLDSEHQKITIYLE